MRYTKIFKPRREYDVKVQKSREKYLREGGKRESEHLADKYRKKQVNIEYWFRDWIIRIDTEGVAQWYTHNLVNKIQCKAQNGGNKKIVAEWHIAENIANLPAQGWQKPPTLAKGVERQINYSSTARQDKIGKSASAMLKEALDDELNVEEMDIVEKLPIKADGRCSMWGRQRQANNAKQGASSRHNNASTQQER